MTMARLTFSDHGPFQHVQRCEQRGRPVALVIVRLARGQAGTQRKDRLCPVQRLNLTFLVHAQNNGVIRWVQIQPHNIADLARQTVDRC